MNKHYAAKADIEDAFRAVLDALQLEHETDPDLIDTPARMARMYADELCHGLFNPPPTLTRFDKPKDMDQLITVGPIVVHSLCPHHFAPIIGNAWVGVIPGSHVLGLSKYARLVRWCAARPIMQESLTELIVKHLQDRLDDAVAVGCVIRARHMCMTWRGVRELDAETTTSALKGLFFTDDKARNEFMRFVHGR